MAKSKKSSNSKIIRNVVVISDTHFGCRLALCPPSGSQLDDGGHYTPSDAQKEIWNHWRYFWDEWVPKVTHGEPYTVVHNGDALDGSHHGSTTQISQNIMDQRELAYSAMKEIVERCEGRYYHVRGTEAHVGKSGADEEEIAKRLGAIPNKQGQFARWDLWMAVGDDNLVHFSHHIGTTGSNHYESTAVHKELCEAFTEAGRWGDCPPDVVVRSHRHRCIEIRIPGARGYAVSLVTPGWQAKTPFAYRIAGGRQAQPQIGGCLIRQGDEELHTRHCVWTPERPYVENPGMSESERVRELHRQRDKRHKDRKRAGLV
jgi:hypothetical protein